MLIAGVNKHEHDPERGHAETLESVERDLKLRELLEIKEGDVIPVDMNELHLVTSGDTPLFTAKLGESRGKLAFELEELYRQA